MNFRLENVPDEPPVDVERVVNFDTGEIERLSELPLMLKADRLFGVPDTEEDSRYRSPDFVQQYTELSKEIMSSLRGKETGSRLTYRRLVDQNGEVIKSTQVIEYCEGGAVPLVITCDRFPEGEVPADVLKKVEDFLDDHYRRIVGEI